MQNTSKAYHYSLFHSEGFLVVVCGKFFRHLARLYMILTEQILYLKFGYLCSLVNNAVATEICCEFFRYLMEILTGIQW